MKSHWEKVQISEIASVRMGKTILAKELVSEGIPVYSAGSTQNEWGYVDSSDVLFGENTIVISARGNIGTPKKPRKVPFVCTQTTIAVSFNSKEIIDYCYYFFQFFNFKELTSQTTIPMIRVGDVNKITIFLPPIEEQNRIVAKIEALFSELDNSIESLQKAKRKLALYRQSILKSAFEGELTKAWREAHQDELEDAETLLERIKKEREAAYEKSLDEWKDAVKVWEENGKDGKKPTKPKKLKELPPLSEEKLKKLPELPKKWKYESLISLNTKIFDGPFGSNLKSSDYVDYGIRVIRLENIGNLKFNDKKVSYITEKKYETIKKHTVQSGDIIFSSFIADNTRVVKLPPNINHAINKADCFCVRVLGKYVNTDYITLYLSSKDAYLQFEAQIHGATRPRINTKQLGGCQIPLTDTQEQNLIVNEIESRFSEADAMEKVIDKSLKKAELLRQSILKQAFEGKLVKGTSKSDDEMTSDNLKNIKQVEIV